MVRRCKSTIPDYPILPKKIGSKIKPLYFRFLVSAFLLILSSCVSARELSCTYADHYNNMWPSSPQCKLSSVDLSGSFKTVDHTFTGTPEQKAAASIVQFASSSNIEFLPKQIISTFPKFNGLIIIGCSSWPTVKNDLFTEEFNPIQYLDISENKIETVEANAFQHLSKLKWINLSRNQFKSLPFQLFKNNPEMIVMWINGNKINSITPDFFKNLNKLQHVFFNTESECIKKNFGCNSGSCSVAQSELDTGLSTCFTNCLKDVLCALESGKHDNLSPDNIEKNLGLIVASGHMAKLVEMNYTDLLIQKGYSNLLLKAQTENLLKMVSNNSDDIKNAAKKFEEMSQDLKGHQDSMATNFTSLIQSNAECKSDKEAINSELESLKQELADIKGKLEGNKDCTNKKADLEKKFNALFLKEFIEFKKKLIE
jgi:hypothetical protein